MNVEVFCFDAVAPVRERGLKSLSVVKSKLQRYSRSREGAWIEICRSVSRQEKRQGRSREGAWIEIVWNR